MAGKPKAPVEHLVARVSVTGPGELFWLAERWDEHKVRGGGPYWAGLGETLHCTALRNLHMYSNRFSCTRTVCSYSC